MKIIYSSISDSEEKTLECSVVQILNISFNYLEREFIYTVRCKVEYSIGDSKHYKAVDIECYDFCIMAE